MSKVALSCSSNPVKESQLVAGGLEDYDRVDDTDDRPHIRTRTAGEQIANGSRPALRQSKQARFEPCGDIK